MSAVKKAVSQVKKGGMVIVIDDEHRENEGDLVMAAQDATPEKINFMLKYGRGLICVPMEKKRLKELKLPIMVENNEESAKCIFTVSVDARKGVTTGISAADRSHTIRLLANPKSKAGDFVRPGHLFPLRGAKNGLKERQGHTEASLELCKRAGKEMAAVICEILNEDGTMARRDDLRTYAKKHKLPIITIKELEGSS